MKNARASNRTFGASDPGAAAAPRRGRLLAPVRAPRTLAASLIATLALALSAPRAAVACAVCFDIADRARHAYYGTAVALTLLPLGILAGGILWLRRAARRQSGAERVRRADAVLPSRAKPRRA